MVVPIRQLTSGAGNPVLARAINRVSYRDKLKIEYQSKPIEELTQIVKTYESRNPLVKFFDFLFPPPDNKDLEYQIAKESLGN